MHHPSWIRLPPVCFLSFYFRVGSPPAALGGGNLSSSSHQKQHGIVNILCSPAKSDEGCKQGGKTRIESLSPHS